MLGIQQRIKQGKYSWPSASVGFASVDLTNCGLKMLGGYIPESSKRQNLNLLGTGIAFTLY